MLIDHTQQQLLHPLMQPYLVAVNTLGDGNCLFHSIWKHVFPDRQEDAHTAKVMRQLTLYAIYKDEPRYRQMVTALGYNYTCHQYLADIQHMGTYCGDLALLALSDALTRDIYCYTSFIDTATRTFFFDTCDFHTLHVMFQTRAQGTWQHTIFTPPQPVQTGTLPLKIIFHINHFTALLNTCMHDDLVPQTNKFNIHVVL